MAARAVGGRTVGAMVLTATAEHTGTALRHHTGDGWAEISYAELGERARAIASGLIALGIEPRRPRRDPRRDAARVDARRLRRAGGGRRRGPDLLTRTPRGVPLRAEHSEAPPGLRARTPPRLAKIDAVRADCPALEHVVVLRAPATAHDARRASQARGGDRRRAAARDPARRSTPTTWRRSSTRRGRPGRRRAACSPTQLLATVAMYERALGAARRAVVDLHVPAAGARRSRG